MRDPEAKPDTPLANAVAFSVHIFTASGAVLALFALLAAIERDWKQTFLLLGAALFVSSRAASVRSLGEPWPLGWCCCSAWCCCT